MCIISIGSICAGVFLLLETKDFYKRGTLISQSTNCNYYLAKNNNSTNSTNDVFYDHTDTTKCESILLFNLTDFSSCYAYVDATSDANSTDSLDYTISAVYHIHNVKTKIVGNNTIETCSIGSDSVISEPRAMIAFFMFPVGIFVFALAWFCNFGKKQVLSTQTNNMSNNTNSTYNANNTHGNAHDNTNHVRTINAINNRNNTRIVTNAHVTRIVTNAHVVRSLRDINDTIIVETNNVKIIGANDFVDVESQQIIATQIN